MFKTIVVAGRITAQGFFVQSLPDGRIVISLGERQMTGVPVGALRRSAAALVLTLAAFGFGGSFAQPVQAESLLNVSYDPTRELTTISTRLSPTTGWRKAMPRRM